MLTLFNKVKYRDKQCGPEQSDLSLHCLLERLLKHFSRRQKQMNVVVIGALIILCRSGNVRSTVAHLVECYKTGQGTKIFQYSKTCLKRLLEKRQNKGFNVIW